MLLIAGVQSTDARGANDKKAFQSQQWTVTKIFFKIWDTTNKTCLERYTSAPYGRYSWATLPSSQIETLHAVQYPANGGSAQRLLPLVHQEAMVPALVDMFSRESLLATPPQECLSVDFIYNPANKDDTITIVRRPHGEMQAYCGPRTLDLASICAFSLLPLEDCSSLRVDLGFTHNDTCRTGTDSI